MTSNDKKLELLKNRIQSDLKVDDDNIEDLLNFVQELIKKGSKDRLLSELKDIYEELADVDSFVEWVWKEFGQTQKHENKEGRDTKAQKEKDNKPKQTLQISSSSNLTKKAIDNTKKEKEEPPKANKKPRFQTAQQIQNKLNPRNARENEDDEEEKLRSLTAEHRPRLKLKGSQIQETIKPIEEHKTGSILDRLIKPSDKLKRPLPALKEEAKKENKYEVIEKKVKPDPIVQVTQAKSISKKIKTAAEVRAEEAAKARAQMTNQDQKQEILEEKSPIQGQTNETHKAEAPSKIKVRCRNWPHCKNEHCIYHHPSENCKFFPNCPYGDKCFYIHPAIPCKFGEYCQRPNCAYVHPRSSAPMNYYGFGPQTQRKPFGFKPKTGPRPGGIQQMPVETIQGDFEQNYTQGEANEMI